jgi:DNA-directed RNA polymerase beta subunit
MHSLEKIYLGKFYMVQSDFCILSGMNKELRFGVGECRNDIGGYFIIDGKTVVPQEKFADNMLYIKHVETTTSTLRRYAVYRKIYQSPTERFRLNS